MARYVFQHTHAPEELRSYPVPIYQRAPHRALAGDDPWTSIFLIDRNQNTIRAEVHFRISEHRAHSRPGAPFGSISFDAALPVAVLQEFIREVECSLRKAGCHTITLVHPPAPYQRHQDVLHALLHDAGFRQAATEVAPILPVNEAPFRANLASGETGKLTRAKKAGLRCTRLAIDECEVVFHFLLRCREERGQRLSLTVAQVLALAAAFPDAIRLYAAELDSRRCAAVLALQDHPGILYTFYYGHTSATSVLSPMVSLLEFVYADCQAQGFHFLNLGTATINQATSAPLLQFKLRLGATPFQKVTFIKTIGT